MTWEGEKNPKKWKQSNLETEGDGDKIWQWQNLFRYPSLQSCTYTNNQ